MSGTVTIPIPIKGLQYSFDGTNYSDIPVAPTSMEIELEQVTANSYRTVDRNITLHNDFLGVIVKNSLTWDTMNREEFAVLSSMFFLNSFIYLRFSNPDLRPGRPEFLACQFKCGNIKTQYEQVDKTTGHPTMYGKISQSFTQRSAA